MVASQLARMMNLASWPIRPTLWLKQSGNGQQEIQRTQDVTILSLASLAETRDNETGAHILRTQRYVRALANHLATQEAYREALDPQTIDLLFKSAPLHDIGKVGIPDAILLKPGKLSDDEFQIMKTHAMLGSKALEEAEQELGGTSFLRYAREIAENHHEKWDGSGYPSGLKGKQIPLSGRLMALADVYDALISKRVYKPAFPHEKARDIILEGDGSHFDPAVVAAFQAIEEEFKEIAASFSDAAYGPGLNLQKISLSWKNGIIHTLQNEEHTHPPAPSP
jgi:response regulator RpfG family c-di-GMP phosphodiesterase